MFSEEFQAEFLERYIHLLRSKSYVVGEHVWNLCDFKTSQSVVRVGGMNLKGVFTRDRRPKLAAHKLRELWK
jgi:beta-glucuronidase